MGAWIDWFDFASYNAAEGTSWGAIKNLFR
jgi:hypothetical protein